MNVANPDGSGRKVLTNVPAGAGHFRPDWSPEGTKISCMRQGKFMKTIGGLGLPVNDIYVMNADGSNQTNVMESPARDLFPAWSPDGSKLAFASVQFGGKPGITDPEIFVVNADGAGDPTQLTDNAARDLFPDWSPDGRRIAFVSLRDGNAEVYIMQANGAREKNLTRNPAYDSSPSWSPDGRRIAFETQRDKGAFTDSNSEIYAMDTNGRNPVNLTRDPIALDSTPAWSSNWRKIAFESFLRDSTGETILNDEIYTMNADSSRQTARTGGFPIDTLLLDWAPL